MMHGQYIGSIDRQIISAADAFQWLSRGDLKEKTESEIIAAQDQAAQTKNITNRNRQQMWTL